MTRTSVNTTHTQNIYHHTYGNLAEHTWVNFMEKKAQGSLEYILLIAGAVLVAAIVIAVMTDMFVPVSHKTTHTLNHWLTHIE